VKDAIKVLGMKTPHVYRSSFNRPNLSYEVRKKDGKTIEVMADYIAKRPNDSGVIYCLSRKDCEVLSEKLTKILLSKGKRNVGVSYYHADLEIHERQKRHHEWLSGRINLLCATIAFGMGVDKPDVRYVMHYSMPKSITHYYQESGRAGRDGDPADCILFYAYKDKKILEMMIRKGSTNPRCNAMNRKIDQLYSCLRYCENEFLCRRTLQLDFFGERFDRANCGMTCDNCKAGKVAERRDLSEDARVVLSLLDNLRLQKNGRGITLAQTSELYRGSKAKTMTKFIDISRIPEHGAGKKYKKADIDRIMHAMIFEGVIMEVSEVNGSGFNSDYVVEGQKADLLRNKKWKFYVEFPSAASSAKGKATPTKKKKTKETKKGKGKDKQAAKKSPKKLSLKNGKFEVPTVEILDSDDDDDLPGSSNRRVGSKSKSPDEKSILPRKHTETLMKRIKKLVTMWADEEIMNGNKLFYWNIMSNTAMGTIASQVPLSVEELNDLSVLGENVVKEYGDRLIKNINSFVTQNNLQKYTRNKRCKVDTGEVQKAPQSSTIAISNSAATKNNTSMITDSDDDFDMGIDFSSIEIPDGPIPAPKTLSRKSSYFQK